ncbi:hypothetical protein C7B61_11600 [filamentous cyanobacterium CCP1]|nr:hypothetical protein C7B76_01060 [filamentous cyanobacterium CCP2]PSB65048.1 hypothetical protein C7B61_11600 [filamentous cyanobacterium CCP1]
MGRYLTRRYVAVDWDEAVRLAGLDQTPIAEIRYTADAELIHRTEWWAWWSDELLTIAIGLPESLNPQGLSTDAVELMSDVWGSDSPQPQCGWRTLAKIQSILYREPLSVTTDLRNSQFATCECLIVEFFDGNQRSLYRLWAGYNEGYWCEISWEPPDGWGM